MLLDLTDDKSTLVQVMAWCRKATSHYLSQCWPRSLSPNGITRPQWVNFRCPYCIHSTDTFLGVSMLCWGWKIRTFSTIKSGISPIFLTGGVRVPTRFEINNGLIIELTSKKLPMLDCPHILQCDGSSVAISLKTWQNTVVYEGHQHTYSLSLSPVTTNHVVSWLGCPLKHFPV